jgi:hypothetical protein
VIRNSARRYQNVIHRNPPQPTAETFPGQVLFAVGAVGAVGLSRAHGRNHGRAHHEPRPPRPLGDEKLSGDEDAQAPHSTELKETT